MANCRMEIKIQIAKCEEAVNPTQQEDGLFVYILNETKALSIDTCEQTLLTALFPIVRETLAQHFSAVSLERAQAAAQSSSEVYTRFTPEGAPSPEVSGYDRSLSLCQWSRSRRRWPHVLLRRNGRRKWRATRSPTRTPLAVC